MFPYEAIGKVRVNTYLSYSLLFRMIWNWEMLYRHCFSSLLGICYSKREGLKLMYFIASGACQFITQSH